MKLSSKQQAMFWAIWARAESEELPVKSTRNERDMFRRKVIFQACGKTSLKDVNSIGDFDHLMYSVATLACDYQAMSYWSIATERRTVHMIGNCARQIGEIVGEPHGWDYCRGVFDQAGLPNDWMDIPDNLLMSTFKMLDTHRRRILKRDFGWQGERSGQPLGFNPHRSYIHHSSNLDYQDNYYHA